MSRSLTLTLASTWARRIVTIEGLSVIQALRGRPPARLLWVTTGAVAVETGDAVAVAAAPVWGLGRTVMQEQPQWAAESAAWFWHSNGLNELADNDQFTTITRRINGGLNGLEERLRLWTRAKAVLCVS